jgi:tetratricopeptide (TPR) repeat protein
MSNAAKHRKKAAEYEQLKQIDRAIASYVRAIEESEAEGEDVDVALLNKVGDLALRQGRVPDAVTYYERAVEHYATAALFNNAIALCNKILRNAPGRSNVYFTLGRICARKGLRGDATRNFLEYATRMQQESRLEEAMRALSEVADLMPELEEVRRMVDEHAARAGVELPRRRTPTQSDAVAAPEAPKSQWDRSSDLIFLDVDYGAPARRTPPRSMRSPTPPSVPTAAKATGKALPFLTPANTPVTLPEDVPPRVAIAATRVGTPATTSESVPAIATATTPTEAAEAHRPSPIELLAAIELEPAPGRSTDTSPVLRVDVDALHGLETPYVASVGDNDDESAPNATVAATIDDLQSTDDERPADETDAGHIEMLELVETSARGGLDAADSMQTLLVDGSEFHDAVTDAQTLLDAPIEATVDSSSIDTEHWTEPLSETFDMPLDVTAGDAAEHHEDVFSDHRSIPVPADAASSPLSVERAAGDAAVADDAPSSIEALDEVADSARTMDAPSADAPATAPGDVLEDMLGDVPGAVPGDAPENVLEDLPADLMAEAVPKVDAADDSQVVDATDDFGQIRTQPFGEYHAADALPTASYDVAEVPAGPVADRVLDLSADATPDGDIALAERDSHAASHLVDSVIDDDAFVASFSSPSTPVASDDIPFLDLDAMVDEPAASVRDDAVGASTFNTPIATESIPSASLATEDEREAVRDSDVEWHSDSAGGIIDELHLFEVVADSEAVDRTPSDAPSDAPPAASVEAPANAPVDATADAFDAASDDLFGDHADVDGTMPGEIDSTTGTVADDADVLHAIDEYIESASPIETDALSSTDAHAATEPLVGDASTNASRALTHTLTPTTPGTPTHTPAALPARRPPFRLDPHDFILPGELPPLLVDDASVEAGLRAARESAAALAVEATTLPTPEPARRRRTPAGSALVRHTPSRHTPTRHTPRKHTPVHPEWIVADSGVDGVTDEHTPEVSSPTTDGSDSIVERQAPDVVELVPPTEVEWLDIDPPSSLAEHASTDAEQASDASELHDAGESDGFREPTVQELAATHERTSARVDFEPLHASELDADNDDELTAEAAALRLAIEEFAAARLGSDDGSDESPDDDADDDAESSPDSLVEGPRAGGVSAVSTTPSLPIAAVAAEANAVAASRRDALRAAVTDAPTDWMLRRRLGEALFEAGQRDAGMAELEAALSGFQQGGRLSDASDVAELLVGVSPERVSYHQKRVELAVRLEDQQRLRFAYLDLADTLIRSGEEARAQAVYVRVLEIEPYDVRARTALGSAAPPAPAAVPDEQFVNLADWLRDDIDPASTRMRMREPVASGDEEADFASLLRHFKEGVSRSLGEEDFESRYDLGVAFKEMGLLDDAIAEFQKALRSRAHRLPTYEALGQCFVEQGRYQVAVTVLSRALHEPGLNDEHRVGVLYLLAYSCEALQRWGEARSYFQRVYATDINFRDVAARLAALERVAS